MKMKKDNIKNIILSLGILLTIGALFLGVPMITTNVMGANITNATTIAKVYVWNTEPNITRVFVSPTLIDLTAGNTTTVNCTGYVWDYNSWSDITNVSATFYDVTYGDGTAADNNYRYINNSCANCTSADGSGTNASCSCQFAVWYYANDGTWQCNMTVIDSGGNATERFYYFNDSEISSTVTINTVLGINAPNEIDYGNLSVTETSNDIPTNISNWGNVPINISTRGWGGTEDYSDAYANISMICDYGNISIGYERYNITNGSSYDSMTNLTSEFAGIPNFTLPIRTNDINYGNDTNTTYWKIQIPLTIGGYCNGTIQFSATDTS